MSGTVEDMETETSKQPPNPTPREVTPSKLTLTPPSKGKPKSSPQVSFAPIPVHRLDVKLTVTESPNPDYEVIQTFWQLFLKWASHVHDLKLLPWHDNSTLPELSPRSRVPNDFAIFKHYLHGVYPRSSGGQLYGRIRISTQQSNEESIKFITEWMRQKGHGLFIRAIQTEEVRTLGWLLYSSLSTDQKHLSKVLTRESGVKIACRFRNISQPRTDKSHLVRAIHLETSDVDAEVAKKSSKQFMVKMHRPPFRQEQCLDIFLHISLSSILGASTD